MPVPVCLAMVVCDDFEKEPGTNKYTLIGTFAALGGPQFPLTHPHITVYVALTDGHGRTQLRLELIDVNEEREAVFHFQGGVTFDDPRHVLEICFQTPAVTIPEPGDYRLRLFANDEFLMERWPLVKQASSMTDVDESWE
jgi:hypothetical protein